MPTINQLPLLSQVSSGDQIPVYSPNNGDSRRLPVSGLIDYFEQNFTSPVPETLFYTPSNGFNIPLDTTNLNVWLLLQAAGVLATGTIVLPPAASVPDGQEITVSTARAITALTVTLNGAASSWGVPSTLTQGDSFKIKFFRQTLSWYRVA